MRVPVDGRPMNINTGHIENAGIEAQIGYRLSPAWSFSANYSYLHMENPVLASPEHKLYGSVDFSRGRWYLSTGIQYIAGLYTSLDPRQTEDFTLWNLQASFRINSWLTVWGRGENLLAQRYEINAGFPMPRASAMFGAKLNF